MKRPTRSAALLAVLAGVLVTALAAAPTGPPFPARIDFPPPADRVVPPGVPGPPLEFSPDGITSGQGTTFYIGNTSNNLGNPNNGSIWKGDYGTGALTTLVPGDVNGGRAIFGLFADKWGRIWTAGCGAGKSCVWDARTGERLATYTVVPTATPQPTRLLDDIVVTDEAAYISNRIGGTNFETTPGAVYNFFRIPLGPGGALPPGDPVPAPVPEARNPAVEEKVLSCGDVSCESAPGIPTYRGSNGIDVLPSGNLVIVSTSEGALWNVNPITGVARRIVTDAAPSCVAPCSAVIPTFGDGLIVNGKTLYITTNRPANAAPPGAIIAVELVGSDPTSGHVVAHLNSPTDTLSNNATAAQVGHSIYVIRARPFAATGLPSATDPRTAWITRVDKLPVTASGTPVTAVETVPFTGGTATFDDPDTSASAAAYTASIDWGDGSSSPGTATGSAGSFSVTRTHIYADQGSYTVTTTITDAVTSQTLATATSTATVSPLPAQARSLPDPPTASPRPGVPNPPSLGGVRPPPPVH